MSSHNSDAFFAAFFGALVAMSLDNIDRNTNVWVRESPHERTNRARALRLYARNCQACALGGTSRNPDGRTSKVSPRSYSNQLDMVTKALRLARAANRVDSSVVSHRAVFDLETLYTSLRARPPLFAGNDVVQGLRSVDIS